MPKYKKLSNTELEILQQEFINFLVINGIKADDWVKLKTTEPEKANKTIELFSDVVYEGTLRKIKYLKKIEANQKFFFRFGDSQAELILLESKDNQNFTKYTTKKYTKSREEEVFFHLQSGCEIDKEALFEKLIELVMS